VFESVNQGIERSRIDKALFDEKGFERFHAQGWIGGHGLMFVVVSRFLRIHRSEPCDVKRTASGCVHVASLR
jgi:hypothetical protein